MNEATGLVAFFFPANRVGDDINAVGELILIGEAEVILHLYAVTTRLGNERRRLEKPVRTHHQGELRVVVKDKLAARDGFIGGQLDTDFGAGEGPDVACAFLSFRGQTAVIWILIAYAEIPHRWRLDHLNFPDVGDS